MKWCGIVLVLIALGGCTADLCADEDPPPFDVDAWLQGPDRQDFPWDVKVYKPLLTMQQRFLAQIQASIDLNKLSDRELRHHFHFVVKVANAEEQWIPNGFHAQTTVPPSAGDIAPLTFDSGLYLRPGRYTIAVIAYDEVLNQGNIRRQEVRVSGPRGDPLPELDRDLPTVEFISGVPGPALMAGGFFPADSVRVVRAGWPIGEGREWLPVKNRRDLCIDIIVNTSVSQETESDGLRPWWEYNYRANSYQMMHVASVLSHLKLRTGSVRVTILDALRMKTIFDREDAGNFDWKHASEVVENQDQATVDKRLLSSRDQAPVFLLDSVRKILDDGEFRRGSGSPIRIVIFVSSELRFDDGFKRVQIAPQDPRSVQFMYFYVAAQEFVTDDIFRMLKPAKPRCFFLLDPSYFRKALASLISILEK